MNFEIRAGTYQHCKWDLPSVIKLADRVSRKIFDHEFRFTNKFGGHPWDALDGMYWEEIEGHTDYINDRFSLLYDIGKALYHLDGEGYNGVADVVTDNSTDSFYDITYRLKPKYAQMVKDDMEELKTLLTKQLSDIEAEEATKKAAEQAKIDAARNGIANMTVKTIAIQDEGGKTEMNEYTVTTHTGRTFEFSERNIFDFGRVINPSYEIAPGKTGGLLILNEDDNQRYWHTFDDTKGWVPVRKIEEDEEAAYTAVQVLGLMAKSGIRM